MLKVWFRIQYGLDMASIKHCVSNNKIFWSLRLLNGLTILVIHKNLSINPEDVLKWIAFRTLETKINIMMFFRIKYYNMFLHVFLSHNIDPLWLKTNYITVYINIVSVQLWLFWWITWIFSKLQKCSLWNLIGGLFWLRGQFSWKERNMRISIWLIAHFSRCRIWLNYFP